jgi:hypothetical protein
MQTVALEVNESVTRFQRQAKLLAIEQELQLNIGLVQPDRHFVEEFYMVCFIRKNQDDKNRKTVNLKFYILNDQILISNEGTFVDMVSLVDHSDLLFGC